MVFLVNRGAAAPWKKLFDELWERLNGEWDKAVQEIERRQPQNAHERQARDYAILANAIDQNSPMEECLRDAFRKIESEQGNEIDADRQWQRIERQAAWAPNDQGVDVEAASRKQRPSATFP